MVIKGKLTKRQIENLIRDLPDILTGSRPDRYNLRATMTGVVAHYLFTKLSEAYKVKSAGGRDEFGNQWADNSPATKRRKVAGMLRSKKGKSSRGLLTTSQDANWKQIYSSMMRRLAKKGVPYQTAKQIAAGTAWNVLKSKGAVTIKDLASKSNVPIMVDSGRLFKSYLPGKRTSAGGYRPYNRDQYAKVVNGNFELGSKVPYQDDAQSGKRKPNRPIIPNQWGEWLDEAFDLAFDELSKKLEEIL